MGVRGWSPFSRGVVPEFKVAESGQISFGFVASIRFCAFEVLFIFCLAGAAKSDVTCFLATKVFKDETTAHATGTTMRFKMVPTYEQGCTLKRLVLGIHGGQRESCMCVWDTLG